jgi:hypothetical protein
MLDRVGLAKRNFNIVFNCLRYAHQQFDHLPHLPLPPRDSLAQALLQGPRLKTAVPVHQLQQQAHGHFVGAPRLVAPVVPVPAAKVRQHHQLHGRTPARVLQQRAHDRRAGLPPARPDVGVAYGSLNRATSPRLPKTLTAL